MGEAIFWGAVLRTAQAAISATPTILVGLFVAGVLRRLLGRSGTRRLFGCGTWRELPQAWLVGMLLPVCSLGVIPVAREMRRAGVSPGAILAFAMTAPLFNPLSMLYGLTLSKPSVILAFAFASMVIVTLVGAALNRLFPGEAREEPAPPPVAHGLRRMASIAVVAAREISGPSLGYILVGIAGVGLLSAVLPPGSLQSTMEHTNPYAPLAMAGVAIPAYASPMTAIAQLGSMFQHANSVGAAFVLLTLGAGVNLGLIAWVLRNYGVRKGFAWLGLLLVVILAIAYAIEDPLYPWEITPPGHTHAFDMYCRPFHPGESHPAQVVTAKIRESILPFERVSLVVLGSLVAVGMALRALDRRWRIESWLERPAEPSDGPPGWLNLAIPAPALGVVALLGLVVLSVVGCYAFYPTPAEVFEEMTILKAEVLTAATSGDRKHVEHFVPVWDDWTRRLEVGAFLRAGSLSPYRRMKAKVFRDRLELLKHAVEEGDRDETKDFVAQVSKAYAGMRRAFLETH
jgi:uncharacterized membrane protein YraQ (UPF0718 family)